MKKGLKRLNDWYVADFETTSYKTYLDTGETHVWLYAICDKETNIVNHGTTIDEFIAWCMDHSGSIVYFHNLRFDGSFIIYYLLTHGYIYKEKVKTRDKMSFATLIGEMGEYYEIRVAFKTNCYIIFHDSLKIIPIKVKQLAKEFNLPIEKEKIDYDKYEVNETTLSYVYKDVQIVAMGLKHFKDKGLNKMTIGSNAYNTFDKMFKYTNVVFPLLDEEFIETYRKAYRGGRSQVNPKYAGKILENVKRYDINSMYPYCMMSKPIPYGKPIKCDKPGKFKFELYKVDIWFELKEGHLPSLLKKGSIFDLTGDTYYTKTDGVEVIYISSIDLNLVYKNYDVKYIKYQEIYGFYTCDKLFRGYVSKYYELKNNSKGGEKIVYKLMLNSLYGKFGSKLYGKHKIPTLEEERIVLHNSELERMKEYYLPVAIAITSYAHELIDNAINYDKENFVYCDTDSVHTLGDLPLDWVDNKELGKFKLEGIEIKSKYIRQKCYLYKENDKYQITCSGMTQEIKDFLVDKYEDGVFKIFDKGLVINENTEGIVIENMKLRPKQVKGGCVLVPVPFSIK